LFAHVALNLYTNYFNHHVGTDLETGQSTQTKDERS